MQIAIGIALIIVSLFLVIAVLLQHGKSHRLSGVISGGAETFFGKEKGSTIDKKLSKLTTIVAIVFALLVLVSYYVQDNGNIKSVAPATGNVITAEEHDHDHTGETVEGADTAEAEAPEETEAP